MYVLEESGCAVIPMKLPNKEAKASAEAAEGRARTKENEVQHHTYPTQSGIGVSQGLDMHVGLFTKWTDRGCLDPFWPANHFGSINQHQRIVDIANRKGPGSPRR